MLDPALTKQLAQHLELLRQPVELVASLDDSAKSAQLMELLTEVAALSEKITVVRRDDDERRPSFAIVRPGTDISVRFACVPLGHELTSFVLALLQVGGHPPAVSEEVIEQIRRLDGDYEFVTYLSLSCQNCPEVVQALNLMSVVNPRIKHVAVDGALFKDEVEARGVLAVPSVFLNGEHFEQGRMTLEQILSKLDSGAAQRAAQEIGNKEPFDVLVVGAGPAGVSSAIYAARKSVRTGVAAGRIGGQVLDTMAIENFISVPYTEGPKFAAALEQHASDYEIDIMDSQQAVRLEPATQPGDLHTLVLENDATLKGRTIILATGARWRPIGVPGEQEYRNKGVTYCPHCDGPLFRGKPVAVIGGGNSGVEAAIDLAGIVSHVTLLELGDTLRADEVLQRKLRSLTNVDIVLNAKTTEVLGDGTSVTGLTYTDTETGESRRLDVQGVFVQIGLLPNTEWLEGVVELTKHKEIVVDERGATSVPGVFAAGDCTTEPYKQIVTAMGSGATAALSAFDYLVRTSAPTDD
ncbi:alkyl hydroperoxide reductase subunit F [Saccharomonospora viridis]|uniref:Alkyl hydroperoxide reductase subunit F n=1 Tax=Saccharomonospora viridis TaxID=1852 RepID=A0A837D6D7_9PSEU|nr:alkyl hydroperoxide reductase subunit F [Saccharomonospora viridis]KHF43379.1 alkyl hydroperoxide reductase subunit F [Saccharomonospora viridis]SFO79813.1 alkyl hydroperoxide reductase subunit F [Saccharomonospora viridis]